MALTWRPEPHATGAALEVWGEPRARVDVADASVPARSDEADASETDASSAGTLGTIEIAGSGSARLELPAGIAGDRGVTLTVRGSGSAPSIRLDEIVVWLR
jgi:hypothetical protein